VKNQHFPEIQQAEMTNSVSFNDEERQSGREGTNARVSAMLSRLGIETRLQLAITVCVVLLIVVTTLGGSGGAPWVFFTYRTLLIVIAILGAIGSRNSGLRISRVFLGLTALLLLLMLISVLRIPGSHFEGFYLWYKYAFFACAFVSLANYARYQSARWKAVLLGTVVAMNLAHLLPDLLVKHGQAAGFSRNNPNYFATFLLVGFAASLAAAVFGTVPVWRGIAAGSAGVILFGVVKTWSRGATLAAIVMIVVIAIRARGRIPRQVWLVVGLLAVVTAVISSPYLIGKFLDRGQVDPYNYARTEIWLSSLNVIARSPVLGVGFGQFYHISKRYTLPVEGTVARYLKRAQIAHNEYLQHIAELGIPAALLLFSLLGYLLYLAWKRTNTAWPEYRCFHEAALLTAVGVGTHALVDNCWTIPVTASSLVLLSLADPLPLQKKEASSRWSMRQIAFAGALAVAIYIFSIGIPGLGLYYNDRGHKAYDRDDFANAERFHLASIRIVPNHPVFLDNLGMAYLQKSLETKDPKLLDVARTYFDRAIAASPQSLDPHVHLETVLTRQFSGDPVRDRNLYQEIIQVDTQLLEIDPFIPFARKNLAGAYYNLGQQKRAFEELQTAIDYEPNYVPGYLQMAAWYADHGDMPSNQRYTAAAFSIVNKYRNFKPTQAYEGVLLGRPEASWITLTGQNR
jgi:O-antigen ligase